MPRIPLLAIRHQPPPWRRSTFMTLSFLLPLAIWSAISYLPFLWHPLVEIDSGGGAVFAVGDRIPRSSWSELEQTDVDWWRRWQADGGVASDGFLAAPGEDAIPHGRRLRRQNQKAVYSFAPFLLGAGLISDEQERDLPALHAALKNWQARSYAGGDLAPNAANRIRMDVLLERLPDPTTVPDDAVLPCAAPQGRPANPVFLPAPHAVASALITGFSTPPPREDDPWLHERLLHSLLIVAKGFGLALLFGLPLGIIAGTFPSLARLIEPVTGFIGYIPPPAFAALLVAVLGLRDGPKVGIVFIASVFPMIIMVANTVRSIDQALIEAAQTLGARPVALVKSVIIPAAMPRIYNDVRVLLALGWTILIIAEITGEKSGLSAYMEQMGRYRQYDRVFAAMLIIGGLGLVVDQVLGALHPVFFPWQGRQPAGWLRWSTRQLDSMRRWLGSALPERQPTRTSQK